MLEKSGADIRSPWTTQYPADVPASPAATPPLSMPDLLDRAAAGFGGSVALSLGDHRWTYTEMQALVALEERAFAWRRFEVDPAVVEFARGVVGERRNRAFVEIGRNDQAGLEQHANVEMQMAGVDSEPLGELTVRQLPFAFLAEHLQDAHPQRVSQRLQLLGLVEYQRLLHGAPSRLPPGQFYI